MKQSEILTSKSLLHVQDLVVEYPVRRNQCVQAVSKVSFAIAHGETFGLVGESGCGKSSVARAVMQLPAPTSGRVVLDGEDLTRIKKGRLRQLRKQFQMVFQDPVASLNPRRKIGKSVEVSLQEIGQLQPRERKRRTLEMLKKVGLDPVEHAERFPFQLSGGQCQRASIARALICNPRLLVCDEPVSSLDVSVQAQIINLLRELKSTYGLSMLFISHDLSVVKNICDRVAVMYLGHLCEIAPTEILYRNPLHPYTRALFRAIPLVDPAQGSSAIKILPGELPSAMDPPSGCRFRTRCPKAQSVCTLVTPVLQEIGLGHWVACHYPHFYEDEMLEQLNRAIDSILPYSVVKQEQT